MQHSANLLRLWCLILGALLGAACAGQDGPQPNPTPTSGCPRSDLMDVGIAVSAGEQASPKVALAADGHAWVTWYSLENGNSNVRAQRLDRDGQPMLTAGGLLVSDKPSGSWVTDYSLGVDTEGAAIVAVNDVRNGSLGAYAYKLTPAGDPAWGRDGVLLSRSSAADLYPRLAMSQHGEAVVAWDRVPADGPSSVVVQRLSGDGSLLWGNGLVTTGTRAASAQSGFVVPADGNAVVLVWGEGPGASQDWQFILARKIDSQGQALWPADVVVAEGQDIPFLQKPILEPDDDGGTFVAWMAADSHEQVHTFVQHLDRDGRRTMPAGGVAVSLSTSTNQFEPNLAFVRATREAVVVWSESSIFQVERGLSAQRLTLDGARRWGANGIELIARTEWGPDLAAVRPTQDSALLVYGERTSPGAATMRILGAHLSLVDAPAWNPAVLSARVSQKGLPLLGGTPECGAWAVWQDKNADEGDIRGSFLAAH